MAYAMVPIYTQTVSTPTATITFNNIPTTYNDLRIEFSTRNSATNVNAVRMRFNGATTGYTDRHLIGSGASASSSSNAFAGAGNYVADAPGTGQTANTFGSASVYIPNYLSSAFKQSIIDEVTENNATTAYTVLNACLWSNTAAINSIELFCNGANFVQYSTFTLYGIKNA